MKHCGGPGENFSTFECCVINDLGDIYLVTRSNRFNPSGKFVKNAIFVSVLALDLEQGGHNSEKSQKLLKRGFKNFPER